MLHPNRTRLDEEFMAGVTFTIGASLHQDYGGENFIHEILGKISIRNVDNETEEAAGELRASLVQFGEAQAHGISSRVLGDGFSLEISRYWQELFDLNGHEFKVEIQNGWLTEGTDLLIISSVQIPPKYEASGIGLATLGRTIALFSRSCDLVACLPKGMEDYSQSEGNFSQPKAPNTSGKLAKTIARLQDDCLKAGFRAFGETGIYLLNPTHKRPDVQLE